MSNTHVRDTVYEATTAMRNMLDYLADKIEANAYTDDEFNELEPKRIRLAEAYNNLTIFSAMGQAQECDILLNREAERKCEIRMLTNPATFETLGKPL